MKFLIKDKPFSIDEFYGAIQQYRRANLHFPSYALIHPDTRRNILVSLADDDSFKYRVVDHGHRKTSEEIKGTEKIFDLYLLTSKDVEPGFLIICG